MKRSWAILVFFSFLSAGHCALPYAVYALDPPHNSMDTDWQITCSRCHYSMTGPAPAWATQPTTTDNTTFNNLCTSCHSAGNLTSSKYEDIKTHSSANTSTKYGEWTVECRACHQPHFQQQAQSYAADAAGGLATGTVTALSTAPGSTVSTITDSGAAFTPGQYAGFLLIPNTAYPARMYRIKDNTANQITVFGAVNPAYAAVGAPYAVKYGKMVKNQIATPRSGVQTVKFLSNSGPGSFGTSTSAAAVTSICQACHTQTTSFNRNGMLEGPGHPADKAGTNCVSCHSHSAGFRANCDLCHGFPPLSGAWGQNGLAYNDGGTGSSTPGAHAKHAVTRGYVCSTCHSGGMPETPAFDKKIQIGFAPGASPNGSYDGRSQPLANGYNYEAGSAGTSITRNGTMGCSNIYCHGGTLQSAGTNTAPRWNDPATAACGSCHGILSATNYPIRGSHARHTAPRAGNIGMEIGCQTCHYGTTTTGSAIADQSRHVNYASDWEFDTADSRVSSARYRLASSGSVPNPPSASYGTCSTVYCHSTAQSATGGSPANYATATWGGGALSCGSCHKNMDTDPSAPGSHVKHAQTAAIACATCHSGYTETSSNAATHVDSMVNVSFSGTAAGSFYSGGTSSGNHAPAGGYGSCTNVICHSSGQSATGAASPLTYATVSWGGTVACGSCHKNMDTDPSAPGSHVRHAQSSGIACATCHSGYTATTVGATHADSTVNVSFSGAAAGSFYSGGTISGNHALGGGYGTCQTSYCHGNYPGSGKNASPAWGQASSAPCGSCHGASNTDIPNSGSHMRHADQGAYNYACTLCHKNVVGGAGPAGYAIADFGKHVNGLVDWQFDTADARVSATAAYSISSGSLAPSDGTNPRFYGTCSNTYCHSNGTGGTRNSGDLRPVQSNVTPTWGTGALACNKCHGVGNNYGRPSYSQDMPKSNSHAVHEAHLRTCNVCHVTTTTDGSHITSTENHVNGVYDVAPDTTALYGGTTVNFVYSYSAGGGTCSNVSCHSGGGQRTWGWMAPMMSFLDFTYPACYEIKAQLTYEPCNYPVQSNTCVAEPIQGPLTVDWGDGTQSQVSPGFVSHVYSSAGPFGIKVVDGLDAKSHVYTSLTYSVNPQQANTPPTIDDTVVISGCDSSGCTVTLTDKTVDPDCNTCGHGGGPGTITISWGDGTSTTASASVPPCGPSNQTYTHLYTQSNSSLTVRHAFVDNAGTAGTVKPTSLSIMSKISNTVVQISSGPLSGVTMMLKNNIGSLMKTCETGPDGKCDFTGVSFPNTYQVQAYKLGVAFDCDPVTAGNQDTVTVTVPPDASVSCTTP